MVRVRFAPSPTGFVHVGSLRTALYNYLFAKLNNGDFILRVEDTDQTRYSDGAVENLLSTLNWCGLEYDEGPSKEGPSGPYYQSQRLNIYNEHVSKLLSKEYAYPCFCDEGRLEKLRSEQAAKKMPVKYDGKCRSLSKDESEKLKKSKNYVVRMIIPREDSTKVNDIIRGEVHFQNELIDDQILIKSDGFPTYHLANVVDDHLMKISHVIRGEEWLPSTPKHILLYRYFGWDMPEFAHLPLLLNPDRSKLSKRQGDVAVEDFKDKGYLPQALINFVALLGWNKGDDQEIFSLSELIKEFSLERVNKSAAIFNISKLDWMNGVYIRRMSDEEYINQAEFIMKRAGFDYGDANMNRAIVLSVKKSLITLKDLEKRVSLFFSERIESYSEKALEWVKKEDSKALLRKIVEELEKIDTIDLEKFKQIMKNVQKSTNLQGQDLWMPIRSAMTGLTEGPDLPLMIAILGRDKMINFINHAISI
jgi:glutamyl-tRNA synthetase